MAAPDAVRRSRSRPSAPANLHVLPPLPAVHGPTRQELGLTIEQPFEKQLRTDVLIASIIVDVREALLQPESFPSISEDVCDEPSPTGTAVPPTPTAAAPAGASAPAAGPAPAMSAIRT